MSNVELSFYLIQHYSFVSSQLNDSKYLYLLQISQFDIHLFTQIYLRALSEKVFLNVTSIRHNFPIHGKFAGQLRKKPFIQRLELDIVCLCRANSLINTV